MYTPTLRSGSIFCFALFTFASALPTYNNHTLADRAQLADGHVPDTYKPKIVVPPVNVHRRRVNWGHVVAEGVGAIGATAMGEFLDHEMSTDENETAVRRDLDSTDVVLASRGSSGAIVDVVTAGIKAIIDVIKNKVAQDNAGREQFTQETVANGRQQFPQYSWIICHVKHTIQPDGVRGVDWGHYHEEYDIKVGGTIGYEVYWLTSGNFTKQGDGGYINWAWSGVVVPGTGNAATIQFVRPT